MNYPLTQQTKQRPNAGDSNNQHPFRPRTLAWHSDDYQEIFIHVSASKYGFNWKIIHDGKLLKRDFGISSSSQSEAILEQQAAKVARDWIQANLLGDVRIRVRSALERAALFGAPQEVIRRRRAA